MLQIEIRIKGQIGECWLAWFEGLTITHTTEGQTTLSGTVQDQAALYGLIAKIRDLNLTLLSVSQMENKPDKAPP